jgi:hypothetical protein
MKTLFTIILFLFATSIAFGQNNLPRVKVKDNHFVINDSVVVFRGLNTSDPEKLERDGQWNEEYFRVMKSWGANIVRFPVHPVAWRKLGTEAYINLLNKGIEYAGNLGMYVIIDWHSIGNLCTEKFQATMYETTRKETTLFWDMMSKTYKDNTTVAFFEFFNEPTVMNGKLGDCSWASWKQINEELIALVRKNGALTIPLIGGFNWAYDLTPVARSPIDAEGIGYVSHPYPMKRKKPWEPKWTEDWGFVAKKYPLILTEIGFCGEGERGAHIPVISDESYGDAITTYAKKNNISYVVWVFDAQWAPALIESWDFTPTRQGRYFKAALGKK